ncbi:LamG domain-containing protein [Rhodocaloribacter sp.]
MKSIFSFLLIWTLAVIVSGCEVPTESLVDEAPGAHPSSSAERLAPAPATLEDGLVVDYPFDEGAGTVLHDHTPNHINGIVEGGRWTQGVVGPYALQFRGRGRVEAPKSTGVLTTVGRLPKGSISVWFKYEGIARGATIAPILYLGDAAGQNSLIIEVGHPAPEDRQKLYFTVSVKGEAVQCFDSNAPLKPGQWVHFVAVVGDRFNTGYLNGREMVNRHYNAGDSSSHLFFASVPLPDLFTLGYGAAAVDDRFTSLMGALDEVRIYDRPLSAAEVRALYALGK